MDGTRLPRFHKEWLHLSSPGALIKNPELYPDFDADTAADLETEYDRFVLRMVAEGDFSSSALSHGTSASSDASRFVGNASPSSSRPSCASASPGSGSTDS